MQYCILQNKCLHFSILWMLSSEELIVTFHHCFSERLRIRWYVIVGCR